MAKWSEALHPRAADGKFKSKGGGESAVGKVVNASRRRKVRNIQETRNLDRLLHGDKPGFAKRDAARKAAQARTKAKIKASGGKVQPRKKKKSR